MTFCWVPGGECQLGSSRNEREAVFWSLGNKVEPYWLGSEAQEKRVLFSTSGFWLGKYEVTQGEWEAVMKGVIIDGVNLTNPSYFRVGDEGADSLGGVKDTRRYPVERVSWDHCQEFLKRANTGGIYRAFGWSGRLQLPHEDQWEYACRGGRGNLHPFYWGHSLNGSEANCDGKIPFGTPEKAQNLGRTCSVDYNFGGKYPVHPWGLQHMHENVWEWCDNWYDSELKYKTVRGGSWNSAARNCRAAHRELCEPRDIERYFGFRLCISGP